VRPLPPPASLGGARGSPAVDVARAGGAAGGAVRGSPAAVGGACSERDRGGDGQAGEGLEEGHGSHGCDNTTLRAKGFAPPGRVPRALHAVAGPGAGSLVSDEQATGRADFLGTFRGARRLEHRKAGLRCRGEDPREPAPDLARRVAIGAPGSLQWRQACIPTAVICSD
jgi:hypothetical protein